MRDDFIIAVVKRRLERAGTNPDFPLCTLRNSCVHTSVNAARVRAFVTPAVSALGEIQRGGALQLGLAHERRPAFVLADGGQNGADVGRIAGAQLGAAFAQA